MRGVRIIIVDIITTNNVVLTKISFDSHYGFYFKQSAHLYISGVKHVAGPHEQII